jgi:hypothetical protein
MFGQVLLEALAWLVLGSAAVLLFALFRAEVRENGRKVRSRQEYLEALQRIHERRP